MVACSKSESQSLENNTTQPQGTEPSTVESAQPTEQACLHLFKVQNHKCRTLSMICQKLQ